MYIQFERLIKVQKTEAASSDKLIRKKNKVKKFRFRKKARLICGG
jgi:hypothetical protein